MATKEEERRNLMRHAEQHIVSGVPSMGARRWELVILRASTGESADQTTAYVDGMLKDYDARHSIGYVTPFGDAELLSGDRAVLTWLIETLRRGEGSEGK